MTRELTVGATDCLVDVRTRGAVAIAEAWVIETDGSRRRLARFRAHDADRALALAALELERRFGWLEQAPAPTADDAVTKESG